MKAELFDRYVREVGRRLPKRQRADVEAELHSLLMDALQDRASEAEVSETEVSETEVSEAEVPEGEAEATASEEDQVAILEELGPPAEVAARYTPPNRYVVGPRLYNVYWIVVAAVSGSLTLAHVVLLALALWGNPEPLSEFGSTFGEVFGNYVSALLAGFGSITLTFFALERILPDSALEELGQEEAWDPRTLPRIAERSRIELGSVIAEIVVIVIALIVFNLFPEWVGINFRGSIDGALSRWHSMPMLAPVFFTLYLPLLNVQWLARIALDVVLLRQGRWQFLTRLADLILTVFGVYIVYRMLFGPPLLTMEAVQPESLRETLESILSTLLKVALGIGLFGTVVESIQKLVRLFRTGTGSVVGRVADRPVER